MVARPAASANFASYSSFTLVRRALLTAAGLMAPGHGVDPSILPKRRRPGAFRQLYHKRLRECSRYLDPAERVACTTQPTCRRVPICTGRRRLTESIHLFLVYFWGSGIHHSAEYLRLAPPALSWPGDTFHSKSDRHAVALSCSTNRALQLSTGREYMQTRKGLTALRFLPVEGRSGRLRHASGWQENSNTKL